MNVLWSVFITAPVDLQISSVKINPEKELTYKIIQNQLRNIQENLPRATITVHLYDLEKVQSKERKKAWKNLFINNSLSLKTLKNISPIDEIKNILLTLTTRVTKVKNFDSVIFSSTKSPLLTFKHFQEIITANSNACVGSHDKEMLALVVRKKKYTDFSYDEYNQLIVSAPKLPAFSSNEKCVADILTYAENNHCEQYEVLCRDLYDLIRNSRKSL